MDVELHPPPPPPPPPLSQESVGEYETEVYNITNLILVSRKRREHLTPEQIHQHEQLQRKVESGTINESDLTSSPDEEGDSVDLEVIQSIPPPPSRNVTWDNYISAASDK